MRCAAVANQRGVTTGMVVKGSAGTTVAANGARARAATAPTARRQAGPAGKGPVDPVDDDGHHHRPAQLGDDHEAGLDDVVEQRERAEIRQGAHPSPTVPMARAAATRPTTAKSQRRRSRRHTTRPSNATATVPAPMYTSDGSTGPKYPQSRRVSSHPVPGNGTTRSRGV